MTKNQFTQTIEVIINSPRNNLQKVDMLKDAFEMYVQEETERVIKEIENIKQDLEARDTDVIGNNSLHHFYIDGFSDAFLETSDKLDELEQLVSLNNSNSLH